MNEATLQRAWALKKDIRVIQNLPEALKAYLENYVRPGLRAETWDDFMNAAGDAFLRDAQRFCEARKSEIEKEFEDL